MCRLTATRVVVMCAAYAAYERLAALFGVSKLGWSMCRLTATRVVVMCAAYAAYERLAALFGVSKLGWSLCRLTATRVVVMCATCRWLMIKAGALRSATWSGSFERKITVNNGR